MSDSPEALYSALAAGDVQPPSDPRLIGAIRQRVADAQKSPDISERRAALAVATRMSDQGGLSWLLSFADDPDAGIRRDALAVGEAAGPDGMPVVRAFLADDDPALSLRVLALLTRTAERTATTTVRGLLSSEHADVRAASAHLLGYIAGPVVRPQLSRLAEGDPNDAVRATAKQALDRIDGSLSRNDPMPWEASSPAVDPTPAQSAPAPAAPASSAAPPSDPSDTADTDDIASLLRALAEAPDGPAADALAECDPDEVATAIRAWRSGDDVTHGVGAALAARQLGLKNTANDLRRRLTDSNPRVRAASARAIGDLGGPATLAALRGLLSDADQDVALAAVEAVRDAAVRLDMRSMGSSWLAPATRSSHTAVASAAKEAKQTLESP